MSDEAPVERQFVGKPERSELPVRRWVERRVVVLAFATLLLVGAFTASMLSDRHADELAVRYVLPVMLAGLELGQALMTHVREASLASVQSEGAEHRGHLP
jgi:hypothetical protein